jgi:hypothetical protein
VYDGISVAKEVVIDVVKAKGFNEQVKVIAKRMYLEKHERFSMKALVFVNGIKSWCYAFFPNDMHLLQNAHDKLAGIIFCEMIYEVHNLTEKTRDALEEHTWPKNCRKILTEKRREVYADHTWVMNHKRKLRNHITMMSQRTQFKNGPLLLCFTDFDYYDKDDDNDFI